MRQVARSLEHFDAGVRHLGGERLSQLDILAHFSSQLFRREIAAGREVIVDVRRTIGVRRFTSNLPGDFGLRTIMGRLPEPDKAAR